MAITLKPYRLRQLLTTQLTGATSTHARIPRATYHTRMDFCTREFETIMTLLHVNYWDKLDKFVSSLPSNTTPMKILVKFRKQCETRTDEIIYRYLIYLHVCIDTMQIIEECVENSIDYKEIIY